MSDFIFSKNSITKGELTTHLQGIYHQDKPLVSEFHGDWGSLAVSRNVYNGFQPYETSDHIYIVLGGPVLCLQTNEFLMSNDGIAGTKAIYKKWLKNNIQWDEDLSGPFVVLIVDKKSCDLVCVTDLMSFIPVYIYKDSNNVMISTHVDALAHVSGQHDKKDIVSQVDFILHGVVTFPFTTYSNLKQLGPASVHTLQCREQQLQSEAYWMPKESSQYASIDEAAHDLRNGLQNYIGSITNDMDHIAQFISGGEDSRLISALLPKDAQRDAFIFLDGMNREGKVAEKAAVAYGAAFNLATRSKTFYLDILPECTDLVGSGSQYAHVHTYRFHKSCQLDEYSAVFGGLLADALLKGSHIKKIRGLGRFPFLPQIKMKDYSTAKGIESNVFNKNVLAELTKRRQKHLEYVKRFRAESAEEWFELWPSSMNMNIPNLHGNRRLFRSYEPFMAKEIVKISATVPQSWKLNRRLFHKAAKPHFKQTKWLLHAKGQFPYYPWYVNIMPQFMIWSIQQVSRRTGITKGNQGPWCDWKDVFESDEWKKLIEEYSGGLRRLKGTIEIEDAKELFDELNNEQKRNLMQVLYTLQIR